MLMVFTHNNLSFSAARKNISEMVYSAFYAPAAPEEQPKMDGSYI